MCIMVRSHIHTVYKSISGDRKPVRNIPSYYNIITSVATLIHRIRFRTICMWVLIKIQFHSVFISVFMYAYEIFSG